jgi:hypothetical protein
VTKSKIYVIIRYKVNAAAMWPGVPGKKRRHNMQNIIEKLKKIKVELNNMRYNEGAEDAMAAIGKAIEELEAGEEA